MPPRKDQNTEPDGSAGRDARISDGRLSCSDPDQETVFYLVTEEPDMLIDFRYFRALWPDPEDCDAKRNFTIGTVVP